MVSRIPILCCCRTEAGVGFAPTGVSKRSHIEVVEMVEEKLNQRRKSRMFRLSIGGEHIA